MDKNQLRRLMIEQRKRLTNQEVKACSQAIVNSLMQLPLIEKSSLIMSYMPYGNEVDVLPLNQWLLEQGKGLCLPRVINSTEMEAVKIERLDQSFLKSSFGIMEPAREAPLADMAQIDLILVPGLAFDRYGNRLGHGKGYYDRFLAKCKKVSYFLGIAYGFQIFDKIPSDPYDIRVKGLVTEDLFANLPLQE